MTLSYASESANARTSFGTLMKHTGEVRKIFKDTLTKLPDIFPNFCSVQNTLTQYEKENVIAGRPKWTVMSNEGEEYTFGDYAQGTEITYTPLTYRDAYDVTEEMMEDNQHKEIMSQASEMAKGSKSIAEEKATDILDNGFGTGTGSDGSYLYVSDHNLINSGDTCDNAETLALDSDGIEAIQLLADNMVDETGQYIRAVYNTVIVPTAKRREAEELMGSDKVPEDANNAKNTYKGRYRVIINQYLASTTAYYLVASANDAENKPRFYWRVKPKFKVGYDVYSDNVLFKARERFVAGFTTYQHTVASTGVA